MAHSVSVDSLTGLPREPVNPAIPYEDPFGDDDDEEDVFKLQWIDKEVILTDLSVVHETFNQSWLKWPNPHWKSRVGKNHWGNWQPTEGMSGKVIHEWRPFHIKSENRSPLDKVILLLEIDDSDHHLVLVNEQGVGDATKL